MECGGSGIPELGHYSSYTSASILLDESRVLLFPVRTVRVVAEFILYDFIVIWKFFVGKFGPFGPPRIGIAAAVGAESGVLF